MNMMATGFAIFWIDGKSATGKNILPPPLASGTGIFSIQRIEQVYLAYFQILEQSIMRYENMLKNITCR